MANYERVNWEDYPSTNTPLDSENLNKMDVAIDAINREVQQAREDIEENTDKVELLHNRIDSLIALPDGSTTADAELVDGRIGYDNTQYNSLGAAIRGQVEDLHDATDELNERIEHVGVTDAVKVALLRCFDHVAWDHATDKTYIDALEAALYEDTYPLIMATFNPTGTIYTDDSLDSLKQYLTVKYYEHWGDAGTIIPSENYTVTGTLTDGENIIRITYNSYKTTIIVNAVDFYNIRNWETGVNIIPINRLPGNYDRTLGFGPVVTVRRGIVTSHGIESIKDDGVDTDYYPIPIPANCKTIKTNCSQSNYYYAIPVWTYNSDTRKYTKIKDIAWLNGEVTTQITETNAMFITVNVKNGTAGTADITVEPNFTIQFSE